MLWFESLIIVLESEVMGVAAETLLIIIRNILNLVKSEF